MTENQKYAAVVEAGEVPGLVKVPLDDHFEDGRGKITNLLLSPITSVARIFSKRGSVRANHYHRTDWHYAFVESGRVLYFERPVGGQEPGTQVSFGPGEMFYTPPMREHAMLFAEDTVIFTLARNVRSHESHEADLVRVEVVSPALAKALVP